MNEFSFNGPILLAGLIIPFAAAFVAAYLLLFCFRRVLRKYPIKCFCFSTQVTVGHIIVLALIFASIVEGATLSLGLPQLTGEAGLFSSKPRLFIDSLIWAAFIFFPLLFKNFVLGRLQTLMLAAFLLMTFALGAAWQGQEQKLAAATMVMWPASS